MTTLGNKTNLMAASRQWADRPADQRFWTLRELYERSKLYADQSKVQTVELSKCEVIPYQGENLALMGPTRQGAAEFQHYSFGQIANLCGAPAAYLRDLPAELAAANMNHGLRKLRGEQTLLFHQNGGRHLRCVTSPKYERIWDYEIAQFALALEQHNGWMTPPARPSSQPGLPVRIATEADVLRKSAHPDLGIRVGQKISPAGLYLSDHDLFIFQVNEDRPIDGGNGEVLYRGVFWSNSEVGDAKFRGTSFLYESICGNHIVWGARIISEIEIVHIGEPAKRFREAMADAVAMMDMSAADDEKRIRAAKQYQIEGTKDKVINLVFRKQLGLSKTECESAYVLADRHSDVHGDPLTAWGFASGVTRLSQQQYGDKRNQMDRAAGKVLEMAL